MHIVFLAHEYPLWSPGGVGSFLQTFGRALVKAGHKVTVVGVGDTTEDVELEDEGVRLIRHKRTKGWLPQFIYNGRELNRKLKQLHSEDPIDIMEATELGLALVARKHRARKVIRLHGGHHFFAEAEKRGIDWKKGMLEKRSFAKADGFIAVSNYVKEHTAKYLSYHNKPLTIIQHPMDTDITIPDIEVQPNHILFAGTVCEKKGARQLIEAFKLVRDRYPEKELHLYGRDWFYPNGDSYIEGLHSDFSADYFENVTFHGNIPRKTLNEKYAQSAICVFPSHMETQGLVTLEAMLLEKPVIFSKYGPGPETINDGQDGLLCDVYDPKDIAEKIIWCIEHPEEAAEMGKKARRKILDSFDRTDILNRNIEFYNQLIS